MDGIEILLKEHDKIEEFNSVLKNMCLVVLEGEKINIKDLRDSLEFIKEYADKIHHGKEEDILFKDIENELGQIGKNLVTHGMLVEHDLARYYVSELGKAIDRYEIADSKENRLELIGYLMAYRDLLGRHIYKENKVVYPYARDNLKKETLVEVNERTIEFEKENSKKRIKYIELLENLKDKYNKG